MIICEPQADGQFTKRGFPKIFTVSFPRVTVRDGVIGIFTEDYLVLTLPVLVWRCESIAD
jgi:hypothetical protein